MSETWFWLDSGPGAADFNMALDEALLESAAARAQLHHVGHPRVQHFHNLARERLAEQEA